MLRKDAPHISKFTQNRNVDICCFIASRIAQVIIIFVSYLQFSLKMKTCLKNPTNCHYKLFTWEKKMFNPKSNIFEVYQYIVRNSKAMVINHRLD